jgi:hypothetical protein
MCYVMLGVGICLGAELGINSSAAHLRQNNKHCVAIVEISSHLTQTKLANHYLTKDESICD